VANWKLSPSDFTFLWEECRRCFYLKVRENYQRPSVPFPKIFTKIHTLLKGHFANRRTEEVIPELPPGAIEHGEKWLRSSPITFPGCSSTCFISGRVDTIIRFDDGGFGVIDIKTAESKEEHIPLYSRQLHAYTYALENPTPGKLGLSPVSQLGLLCVDPLEVVSIEKKFYGYKVMPTFMGCPRNDEEFRLFLKEVLGILESPTPPAGSANCSWCQYRDTARRTGL